MLKADCHVHTEYSMDCTTPLKQIIERCLKVGINCLNIADHGTIEGALKLRKMAPFKVIVSEEILTPDGEIMGMFLEEPVPSPSPSVVEAINRIKSQGGFVCLPHPFDLGRQAVGNRLPEELIHRVDVVEVLNSRALVPQIKDRAQEFAEKYGLAKSAGSDAHTLSEIGNAFVEMPDFKGREDFLAALRQGKIYGHRTTPLIHLVSTWQRLKKRL